MKELKSLSKLRALGQMFPVPSTKEKEEKKGREKKRIVQILS